MQEAFDLAAKQIGLSERGQAAAIQDYLTTGGANLNPAETAWCAAFVNSTLQQSGMKGTGSNMARSYLDWGQPVDTPQKGDIAVFSRGDPNGPYGHVGFFEGYDENGKIRVLGGNQGDAVSIASYNPNSLLGFRRGDSQSPGNALSFDSKPQGQAMGQAMGQQVENALRPPEFNPGLQDPRAFMRQRNALAPVPITYNPMGA